jgi:hypothetical protein
MGSQIFKKLAAQGFPLSKAMMYEIYFKMQKIKDGCHCFFCILSL